MGLIWGLLVSLMCLTGVLRSDMYSVYVATVVMYKQLRYAYYDRVYHDYA